MNSICFFLLLIFVNYSHQLTQNYFTYRFSQWLSSDAVKTCGWDCECPPVNEGNLCNCGKKGETKFSIESPYAALLIKTECMPQKSAQLNPVNVNMTSILEPKIGNRPSVATIHPDMPVLRRANVMPKDNLQIRYEVKLDLNGRVQSFPMSFNQILDRKFPNIVYRPVYILIPGWQSELGQIHSAFAKMVETDPAAVVIVVDWLFGNQFYLEDGERIYEPAVANSVYAGYHLGAILFLSVRSQFITGSMNLIGFDMGAQVAHFAANFYAEKAAEIMARANYYFPPKIHRITGLDPPMFLGQFEPERRYIR